MKSKIQDFAKWARSELFSSGNTSPNDLADRWLIELQKIDDRLGVEIGRSSEKPREIIITSFSDPELFELVHELVNAIGDVAGWKILALKPARGFGFKLSMGAKEVHASTFRFSEIPGLYMGINIYCQDGDLLDGMSESQREEFGWLIVESGVGEELAGMLQHVEFLCGNLGAQSEPIENLIGYLMDRKN